MITVVIPCYNVENYLHETVESVLNQSYENLDIVLVNDGSVDATGELCDQWALKDERIRVCHQQNGGLSHARNVGISMAKGKYITFVDSDDQIDSFMVEKLYRLIVENKAQMSSCLWDNIYTGSKHSIGDNSYVKTFSTKEAIVSALKGKELSCGATGKLYEIGLFDHVLFPLGVTIEDAYIIMKLILQCERVAFLHEKLYLYYHREGSIMHSGFSEKDFNVVKAHSQNKDIILQVYPDLEILANQRVAWAYLFVYDKLLLSETKDPVLEKELRREVLKRKKYIDEGNYFNKGRKLALKVLQISPFIYKKLAAYRAKKYIAHTSR